MLLGCRCSSGRPRGRLPLRTAAEMAARGHLRATNLACFPRAVRPGWRPGIMHHIYAPSGRGSLSCSPTPAAAAGRCWLTSICMGHRALTRLLPALTSADVYDKGSAVHNSLDFGAAVRAAGAMAVLLLWPDQVAEAGDGSKRGRPAEENNDKAVQHVIKYAKDPSAPTAVEARKAIEATGAGCTFKNIQRLARKAYKQQQKRLSTRTDPAATAKRQGRL
jgi:hypothetical protein